jgi:hypothetical protein
MMMKDRDDDKVIHIEWCMTQKKRFFFVVRLFCFVFITIYRQFNNGFKFTPIDNNLNCLIFPSLCFLVKNKKQ